MSLKKNKQKPVSKWLESSRRKHYNRWYNMLERCYNPKNNRYLYYGARGISVCEEWKLFNTFYIWCIDTYQDGLSLDRFDNEKGYNPSNCRWATKSEQARNQRRNTIPYRKHLRDIQALNRKYYIEKFGNPKTREVKHCPSCKEFMNIKNFHRNSSTNDGLATECKPCKLSYMRT